MDEWICKLVEIYVTNYNHMHIINTLQVHSYLAMVRKYISM